MYLPTEAIVCLHVNCNNFSHLKTSVLCMIVLWGAVFEARRPYVTHFDQAGKIKPGWTKCVTAHHVKAKVAYYAWVLAGMTRQGLVLDHKKFTHAGYKYAVCYISKQEQVIGAEQQNYPVTMWLAFEKGRDLWIGLYIVTMLRWGSFMIL